MRISLIKRTKRMDKLEYIPGDLVKLSFNETVVKQCKGIK